MHQHELCKQGRGRSQPHSPGWARVTLSSFSPQILINFSYFSSNFCYFLPHFDPPGGRVVHREGPGYATVCKDSIRIWCNDVPPPSSAVAKAELYLTVGGWKLGNFGENLRKRYKSVTLAHPGLWGCGVAKTFSGATYLEDQIEGKDEENWGKMKENIGEWGNALAHPRLRV